MIDLPNKEIEETYYFRWWTYRKHIKNTDDGFVITEFLPIVNWSGKHNTINCPAAHHIYEGRWLRNPKFITEYINFWLESSGDGIRQYSFWIADAILAFNNIHRNDSILSNQLEPLIKNYNQWEKIRKDEGKSLFFQWDVADGMEVTASGRILNNGVSKFQVEAIRPTINSYMYGDAMAISKISNITNDFDKAMEFENKATVCKYAVPEGYPDKPIKNKPVDISKVKNPDLLFYGSVDIKDGLLVESGSRTIATVGISNSIFSAEKIAEESISCVEGPLFHRTDIGTPLLIEKRKSNMDSLR